jgi:Icc-related predicted phosphoesterase
LPIYIVIGNDDFPETEDVFPEFPLVKNLHLNPVDFGGFELIGFRGAVHVDLNTPTEYNDDEAYPVLKDTFKKLNKPTVLVSHCPPKGVLDTTHNGKSIGSKAILDIIKEFHPLACFCGHVHELGGRTEHVGNTLVANVGCVLNNRYSKVKIENTVSVDSEKFD